MRQDTSDNIVMELKFICTFERLVLSHCIEKVSLSNFLSHFTYLRSNIIFDKASEGSLPEIELPSMYAISESQKAVVSVGYAMSPYALQVEYICHLRSKLMFPISVGSSPVSMFPDIRRSTRLVKCPIVESMCPEKWLLSRYKYADNETENETRSMIESFSWSNFFTYQGQQFDTLLLESYP